MQVQRLQCPGCGADVDVTAEEGLKTCAYCGAPLLLTEAGGATPAAPTASKRLTDLERWEVLDGSWSQSGRALIGSGGHLFLEEMLREHELAVTVEHVGGPRAAIAVGVRSQLFEGGRRRFRDGTADVQGYGFDFSFDRSFQLFRGVGGRWYRIKPEWDEWQHSELLDTQRNDLRISAIGQEVVIFANGQELARYVDDTHAMGSVFFWVENPAQIASFSNIEIRPR